MTTHITRARHVAPLGLVVALVAIHGCSDGAVGGEGEGGSGAGDAGALGNADGAPGAPIGKDTGQPKPIASVETLVSPQHVQAGAQTTVTCVALDADAAPIVGAPTIFHVQGAGPFHIVENHVSFELVGSYQATCGSADGIHVDATPAQIQVIPGDGVVVQTTLSDHEVTAGDTVLVTCEVHDKFGNLAPDAPTQIFATPGTGWAPFGMKMKTLKAGSYEVACRVTDTGVVDATPEKLLVKVGMPRKIVTTLEPEIIQAGGKSKVTCTAVDAYDNPVAGFPTSLKLPAALTLQGLSLTTIVAGNYGVKCVPETDAWDLYELKDAVLQVLPGDPHELYIQQVPAKPVYRKNDPMNLLIQVLDEYANIIPDASILPIGITPPSGVKVVNPTSFTFKEEGKFIFHIEVMDWPKVAEDLVILVDGQGPTLVIEQPARGATLTGKPAVNVTGQAADDVAGVTSLLVNGDTVDVKGDGSFTHILLAHQGMNPIVAEAMDLGGKLSHATRAFTWSPSWYDIDASKPDSGRVPGGLQIWLGKTFIDDGVHDPMDPDDLATMIEKVVSSLDLSSVVPSPAVSSGPYKVYLKNLAFFPPKVALTPFDGGIRTGVVINEFKVKVEAIGSCKILFIDVCPDVKGWVKAKSITIDADVLASAKNGQADVKLGATKVKINGLDVDIEGILGSLFDFLVDWFVDSFTGQIEKTFESQLGDMVSGMVGGLFESLALNETFEVEPFLGGGDPVTLQITTKIGELTFSPKGGLIAMDANIITSKKTAQSPLGSIARANCGKAKQEFFELDKDREIGLAIHDDLINQALFSVWWGALLDGAVDPSMLGDLGGLQDMGIKDLSIKTLLFAAPLLTSCNPGQQLKLQLPDAYIEIGLNMAGVALDLGVFVSLELEAAVQMVQTAVDKQIGLSIGDLTLFNLEIVSINPGWEEAIPDLEKLFKEKLLEAVEGGLGEQALPTFPIPEIDLSTLDPSIPPGTALNLILNDLIRDAGYTSINGEVD